MSRLYRRCKLCGLDWNVSKIEPGGKDYICPTCKNKRRTLFVNSAFDGRIFPVYYYSINFVFFSETP